MTRKMVLAPLALATLLLAGGSALASGGPAPVDLGAARAKNEVLCTLGDPICRGTLRADFMQGTGGTDNIVGRSGNDTIIDDPVAGGANNDNDTVQGGGGNDVIDVQEGTTPDTDTVFGGRGDDLIFAQETDFTLDSVDCGPGRDTVFADPNDLLTGCERVNPKKI